MRPTPPELPPIEAAHSRSPVLPWCSRYPASLPASTPHWSRRPPRGHRQARSLRRPAAARPADLASKQTSDTFLRRRSPSITVLEARFPPRTPTRIWSGRLRKSGAPSTTVSLHWSHDVLAMGSSASRWIGPHLSQLLTILPSPALSIWAPWVSPSHAAPFRNPSRDLTHLSATTTVLSPGIN